MNDGTEWIKTRQDFIKFLIETHNSFRENPQEWENDTLDRFLGALSVYSDDVDGYYKNFSFPDDPNNPSWRIFAQIISGAIVYE